MIYEILSQFRDFFSKSLILWEYYGKDVRLQISFIASPTGTEMPLTWMELLTHKKFSKFHASHGQTVSDF